mmetsp:Transcript_19384/g.29743  ORF Transcript_19384/g.29743 Transcript_19384/m.29743 type:complete len:200 (-) Transcript_19384:1917-2516(-)
MPYVHTATDENNKSGSGFQTKKQSGIINIIADNSVSGKISQMDAPNDKESIDEMFSTQQQRKQHASFNNATATHGQEFVPSQIEVSSILQSRHRVDDYDSKDETDLEDQRSKKKKKTTHGSEPNSSTKMKKEDKSFDFGEEFDSQEQEESETESEEFIGREQLEVALEKFRETFKVEVKLIAEESGRDMFDKRIDGLGQ